MPKLCIPDDPDDVRETWAFMSAHEKLATKIGATAEFLKEDLPFVLTRKLRSLAQALFIPQLGTEVDDEQYGLLVLQFQRRNGRTDWPANAAPIVAFDDPTMVQRMMDTLRPPEQQAVLSYAYSERQRDLLEIQREILVGELNADLLEIQERCEQLTEFYRAQICLIEEDARNPLLKTAPSSQL